ncbi:MAG: MFS transporter [Clostridia bacterium]|nr:MFS transporter [Clostridia bacterium]
MKALQGNTTRIGPRLWFSFVFFGLIGQIAWVVENMYFATLAQDIFAGSGRQDLSYVITTLMVIFSALTATVTTIFAGGLCDRVGKRKPFIAYGYILWGLTIAAFAFIPMRAEGKMVAVVAALLVIFDCLMTFAGSTSNDAAFNAWVADNTDTTNRGKVNSILSMLPVFAVIIIFIGLGSLYSKENESNRAFFFVLGAIPLVAGILALFLLKDAKTVTRATGEHYLRDAFYGFRPAVFRENKMMYVTLAAACIVGISQQTFFSYLMNFVIVTLGYGDGFVIPVAVIILGAALLTGILGVLTDRYGRGRFFFPLLGCAIVGTFAMYLLQFLSGGAQVAVLYIGGVLMMGAILSLGAALSAAFQDYIPHGCEGRFQGVRMCFTVLVPMIIGPIISLCIGLDAMGMNGESFTPPYAIFLAATVVALFAFIPLYFVRRDAPRLREKLLAEKED